MRLLLDECVPLKLRTRIVGHEVSTVRKQGWLSVQNGELLRRVVEAGFEVFITVDTNLAYQQNLRRAGVSVVVLRARMNTVEALEVLIPELLKRLPMIARGDYVEIGQV